MITTQRLRELKECYEKELLLAQAKLTVVNDMIAESETDEKVVENNEVEQAEVEDETIGEEL